MTVTDLEYVLTDQQGSTMAVLDDTGAMIANSDKRYLPFGDVRTDLTITNQTDYGYTGQREVEGSELMDYRSRFLSNSLARFTQPDTIIGDPSNPQTLNRYTYVGNNPINFVDPSGHVETCPDPDACGTGGGGPADEGGGSGGGGGNDDELDCSNTPEIEECLSKPDVTCENFYGPATGYAGTQAPNGTLPITRCVMTIESYDDIVDVNTELHNISRETLTEMIRELRPDLSEELIRNAADTILAIIQIKILDGIDVVLGWLETAILALTDTTDRDLANSDEVFSAAQQLLLGSNSSPFLGVVVFEFTWGDTFDPYENVNISICPEGPYCYNYHINGGPMGETLFNAFGFYR